MDSARTLVLTPWYSPHQILSWQEAVCLVWVGKVDVIEEYDEVVRSPSMEMRIPAVVRIRKTIGSIKRGVKFSRLNVRARDRFMCQYCGRPETKSKLNYDHVVPRHQGGKTTWENIVMACYECNNVKKKNRTPEQAGMTLLQQPYKPKALPHYRLSIDPAQAHPLWKDYLGGVAA